jgi:hypothetical protein
VAVLALVVAGTAFLILVPSGAHLLHFDAKAHMVVSRRVLDNITPGWGQLGTIWLPLPHILNALPAQNDFLYRTALFASLLGLGAFVAGVAALARAAEEATGDRWAAMVAATVPLANPGWLYLQATPLTEPLFFGLVALHALFLVRWRQARASRDLFRGALCCGLACLVRYEAWPIAAASIVLAFWPWDDEPAPARNRRRQLLRYALLALVGPVLLFSLHSLHGTGSLLNVIEGRNLTDLGGEPGTAARRLASGLFSAFGRPLAAVSVLALAVLAWRRDRWGLLVLALCAPAAVTFTAYLAGHPMKARYALLLAPALALALAVAFARRPWAQAGALILTVSQGAALERPLPVLVEATRDQWAVQARDAGLRALRAEYRGGRILASLGSAAPLVFDLGLPIREIVHEGNEDLWAEAQQRPASVAAWMIVYPWDPLGARAQAWPGFLEGFVAVRRLGSATLYARVPAPVSGVALEHR